MILCGMLAYIDDCRWLGTCRFNKIICQSESANNLAATAMVTHAYLQTGDQKYKQWVLEYVDAWLARIEANGGVIPDNVGPSGVVGEFREGQWWGGFYGWNCYSGYNIMFHSIGIAAECAHLLSGDAKCAAQMLLGPHSAAPPDY